MKRRIAWCAGMMLAAAGSHAQVDSLLKKGAHDSGLEGLKGMAGMAGSPLTSGSMSNVAGLLHYCIYNNVLSGPEVESVKDRLTAKLPTGPESDDHGYSDGQKGLLYGSNGNLLDLHGGGLPADVTKKACETVLAQGKSFL